MTLNNSSTLLVEETIPNIVNSHILYLFDSKKEQEKIVSIYKCLHSLLNGHYEKYSFTDESISDMIDGVDNDKFQSLLSNLNEKTDVRKSKGVYYTPNDVSNFIILNSFYLRLHNYKTKINPISTVEDMLGNIDHNESIRNYIMDLKVFDPTCGSGEFLLQAFMIKIQILNYFDNKITADEYIKIVNSIHGNDINIESVEIAKIRLFFSIISVADDMDSYGEIVKALSGNMLNHDYIKIDTDNFGKYDLIIGNPPYVEDGKVESIPSIKYGNIYANAVHNSIDLLNDKGVLGFIIPLSYVSTLRMKKLREYIENNTLYQYIFNYADRPDCLFNSVHQKLSILIAKKGTGKHDIYTSTYKYWYKKERAELFKNVDIQSNTHCNGNIYPKIGNKLEHSLFKKVFTDIEDNLLDLQTKESCGSVFLNMRACFWIKAFTFNPGSKEYKKFYYHTTERDYILCLLNSSLFFWYWIAVSDCWHITKMNLMTFKVINKNIDFEVFNDLWAKLEIKLESTKKYIGTVQTEYEYKHKYCKDMIDTIDDELARIYGITEEELNYIKNFALKYRESRGA